MASALLRLGLGLAIFVGILAYVTPSLESLLDRVSLDPGWLVVGLLGTLVAHVAVAARWKLLSEAMGGTRLRFRGYLHAILSTRFLGQFVSSLAMDLVGRGVALRSVGSRRGLGHATTLVIVERVLDVLLPAALLVWALGIRVSGLEDQASMLLLVCTLLFALIAAPALRPLARLALRVYAKVRRSDVGPLPVELTAAIAWKVTALSLLRFAAVLVQFGAIGAGIGVALSWLDWTAATPIAQLTALIGLTPGGLGVVEAGWWAGLDWVGVEGEAVGLFLVAQRIALITFLGMLTLITSAFVPRGARDRGPS